MTDNCKHFKIKLLEFENPVDYLECIDCGFKFNNPNYIRGLERYRIKQWMKN